MTAYPFTAEDLDALRAWDTPTICSLQIVAPERRAIGFTTAPMVVADRKLLPIVGLAPTGLIRAKEPPRDSSSRARTGTSIARPEGNVTAPAGLGKPVPQSPIL